MTIRRAEHVVGSLVAASGHDLAFGVTLAKARTDGVEPPSQPTRTDRRKTVAATAYVNHGRWIADCPFCPSAQLVSEEDPRFFCAACNNAFVGGAYVAVVFPGDAQQIDDVLNQRQREENRNWFPTETVTDLRDENDAMVPSDDGAEVELVTVRGRGAVVTPGTDPGV